MVRIIFFLEHVHVLDCCQREAGGLEGFESEHGVDDPFHCTMILFKPSTASFTNRQKACRTTSGSEVAAVTRSSDRSRPKGGAAWIPLAAGPNWKRTCLSRLSSAPAARVNGCVKAHLNGERHRGAAPWARGAFQNGGSCSGQRSGCRSSGRW